MDLDKINGKYNVVLAFDQTHSEYMVVLIMSVLKYSIKSKYQFHLIIDKNTNLDYQMRYFKENNVDVKTYLIDGDQINDFHINKEKYSRISDAAYYRLLAPFILQGKLEYYLYLDTDTYVVSSIDEIFDYKSDNLIISAVSEKDMNLDSSNGFSSGVMLINVKEMIQFLPLKKMIELNKTLKFDGDQELLNHFFGKNFIKIPIEYNYPIFLRLVDIPSYKHNKYSEPKLKIIHYLGNHKPWIYSTRLPYIKSWQKEYKDIFIKNPWDRITLNDFMRRLVTYFFSVNRLHNIKEKLTK